MFSKCSPVREATSVTAVSHRSNSNIGIEEEGGREEDEQQNNNALKIKTIYIHTVDNMMMHDTYTL